MEARSMEVTIPQGSESRLMQFVAGLWADEAQADTTTQAGPKTPGTNGSKALTIQEIYEGGTSKRWKSFLEFFAHRPEQWIKMSDGFKAVGFNVQQGVGLVGAAERRCKGNLPYMKRFDSDEKVEVWMSRAIADEIIRLSGE